MNLEYSKVLDRRPYLVSAATVVLLFCFFLVSASSSCALRMLNDLVKVVFLEYLIEVMQREVLRPTKKSFLSTVVIQLTMQAVVV